MKNKFYICLILILFLAFPVLANAQSLSTKMKGRILLQVESNGEAWYINPENEERYYLGRPADAFNLMRQLGLGVSDADFASFGEYAPSRLSGRILLKVEDMGQAYYVSPVDLKMHYLGRPADAFSVMRAQGLGITNENLNQIRIRAGYGIKEVVEEPVEIEVPAEIPDPVLPEDPGVVEEEATTTEEVVEPVEPPMMMQSCEYQAEYFKNDKLTGYPVLTRMEDEINHEWWTGKPEGVNYNNEFSARWTSSCEFQAGTYKFTAIFDDGMRVWIDGEQVIDYWVKSFDDNVREVELYLEAGMHDIKVEYFEYKLAATAKFSWEKQ